MSFNSRDYSPATIDALTVLMETDAYKLDHRRQYPERTEFVYSNLTARGSRIPEVDWTVFFGLQAYLTDLAARWQTFFDADIDEVCRAYDERVSDILGPNGVGSEHIRELHAYGRLPLRFRALPEGTVTPLGIPYLTVENTEPRFFWLTNYIETDLSGRAGAAHHLGHHGLAQPVPAGRACRGLRRRAGRGRPGRVTISRPASMAGMGAASVSGAAHLLSFTGTDSLSALGWIDRFYPGSPDGTVLGGSVPATEHSVMTANGPEGSWPPSSACWTCIRRASSRWSATAGTCGRW